MPAKLKTAVVGATGYSGVELTRLLLRHPQVDTPVAAQPPEREQRRRSISRISFRCSRGTEAIL